MRVWESRKQETWQKRDRSERRTNGWPFLLVSVFYLFCLVGFGSAQATCSLNFTSPARGSTVTSPTVGVSGTGTGNANPGDQGQATATLNGVPFFNQTGTFTVLINFFGSGGAAVTLQPGPNVFNVTGSVNGCSASDSMVVYYTPPPLQAQKDAGLPSCPSNGTNPINGATGNKFQAETDYTGSRRLPLAFTRYYNSAFGGLRELGWNWRSDYDRQLSFNGSNAYITKPDGSAYRFALTGVNWIPDGDVNDKLAPVITANVTTGWMFTSGEDNSAEIFDTTGRLTAIVSLEGYAQDMVYDGTGRLSTVTERLSGRQLILAYDTQNRLSTLTDPSGAIYTYGYDTNNNLTSVTYPDGDANPANNPVRTYVYNEAANTSAANLPHALTGIVDENGNRYGTYMYDASGRGISSEHAAGVEKTTLVYNINGTTTVTDSAGTAGTGTARTYSYQNVQGSLKTTGVTGGACNACGGATTAFTYDANGNVASSTDFNGNLTCYAYDLTRNLQTVRIEGIAPGGACPVNLVTYTPAVNSLERKTTTVWHAAYRLPIQVNEPGRQTINAYYVNGTLQTQTVTDTLLNKSRAWNYTYDGNSQLKTIDGPRLATDVIDVTTFDYYATATTNNAVGDLWKVTDALGHVTTFTQYDKHGRPLNLTDPNGLVITLSYDSLGRLKTKTRGGNTTTFGYYPNGLLNTIVLPDLSSYTYGYDAAHRLSNITDNLANKIEYTPDKLGNIIQQIVKNPDNTVAKTQTAVFDSLNRLQQTLGALNQTTKFTYDANGNLKTIIDPKNHPASILVYDTLERLSQVQDAATGITQYGYDALDQLIRVTAANGAQTGYTVDALGNRLQETSPDRGMVQAAYDEAGNRKTRTDARNIAASYSYDALNRLISITYPTTGENITYSYDTGIGCTNGLGRLCQVQDGAGTTTFAYDIHGNLLGQTRTEVGQNYSTNYGYDSVNRISQITSPGNRTVSYGRNAIGNISSVTTPINGTATLLVGQISANALGLITNQTFANGYSESHGYNTDGQLTSASQTAATGSGTGGTGSAQVPIPNWALVVMAFVLTFISARYAKLHGKHLSMLLVFGMSLALSGLLYSAAAYAPITLHYDDNGNIDQRTDGSGMATFAYDALDRLGSETGPLKTQTLGYDANGNRSGDALGSYIYLPNSNRLQTAHGQAISLDPAGNITSDGVYTYIYNQAGQIAQVKQGVTVIASYYYNYQGRRTHKLVGTTTVLYHYDQAGHTIAETAGNGALLKTYVWRDDAPVAIIDSSSGQDQVYYLEVDSLNTPRTARNQTGTIVWQWNSDAFGSMLPIEDPDSDGILTHINLRFPGQYYDQESGLFYNGARYYHPGSGRYLQPDPIGLAGGINTYTYVSGNPVNFIDPTGEVVQPIVQCAKNLRACGVVLKKVWDGCKWVWEKVRNDDIFSSKAPDQTTPGTKKLEGQYVNDKGRVEPWEAHYDEQGRQIGRTDYNAGNKAQDIPDTHNHTREYNAQFPNGRSTGDHLPGKYVP
jgi:RHS repeat-associated protein